MQLAKTLAAIDVLSEGRLIVGVGPGSSAADYAAVGVPFDERRRRFDETLSMLSALLEGDGASFEGEFYSTHGIVLEPRPAQRPRPPLWVASWGSPSGLRLVAHHGDGWIASAYNTTPDLFRAGLGGISDELRLAGRTPASFTNAIATAWLYITEDTKRAESVLTDVLAPMLKRPVEALRALSLPIGPPSSAPNGSAASRARERSASSSGRSATSWRNSRCFANMSRLAWSISRERRFVASSERMTIQRMEHVGIVVDDLAAATAFFVELGLELLGEGSVEGRWVDRIVGLDGVRVEQAMVQTPDGHGRLELVKFRSPPTQGGDPHAPANTPGIRHVAFAVDDIDTVVAGLRARGAELVGEVVRYEDRYRLCYVRGPEGIIVELAEKFG